MTNCYLKSGETREPTNPSKNGGQLDFEGSTEPTDPFDHPIVLQGGPRIQL